MNKISIFFRLLHEALTAYDYIASSRKSKSASEKLLAGATCCRSRSDICGCLGDILSQATKADRDRMSPRRMGESAPQSFRADA